MRRDELPGGRVVLVVSFGPRMEIDGRTYTSFAAGLHDAPAHTEHDGLGHGIQAYLTPLGARRFFGMPMGELTRQVVELEDLIGREAGELAERLAAAPGWAERIDIFERAIAGAGAARASRWRPSSSGRGSGCVETDGAAPIGALGEELGWSRRHLAARFREELGHAAEGGRADPALRARRRAPARGRRSRRRWRSTAATTTRRTSTATSARSPGRRRPSSVSRSSTRAPRRARPARCRRTARAGRPARW